MLYFHSSFPEQYWQDILPQLNQDFRIGPSHHQMTIDPLIGLYHEWILTYYH